MNKNKYKQELINGMQGLTKEGFQCFILKEKSSFLYGYIITPSDNILYIERDFFNGWTVSLKYKPSINNGSGCQCLEEPFQSITKETILQSEREGLIFAKKLRAVLYNTSKEYFKNLWNKKEFEEVL